MACACWVRSLSMRGLRFRTTVAVGCPRAGDPSDARRQHLMTNRWHQPACQRRSMWSRWQSAGDRSQLLVAEDGGQLLYVDPAHALCVPCVCLPHAKTCAFPVHSLWVLCMYGGIAGGWGWGTVHEPGSQFLGTGEGKNVVPKGGGEGRGGGGGGYVTPF